ncbi:MAG TPA: hypothetical protein VKT77_18050, partial [Chthonomonadaceae bacterium]|nr:hypothetical protein [Chthonomonadaceae bacterium]
LVKYRDDSARACHEFARAAIQSTFRATIQDVQHHVREGLKPVRSGISERLRSLEATLDGALANLRAAESAAPAEDPDRAAIAALRARVVALIPTPQPSAAGVAADAESRASTGTDAVEEIASNRSPGGETRDDPPTVRL